VVLWERTVVSARRTRILPDGCLDVVWDGAQLIVAGPDSVARWHDSPAGTAYTALRFHLGTGPAALGVPAFELAGQSPPLEDVWPAAAARRLSERVAADPAGALTGWAAGRGQVDPVGPRVHAMARRGTPVTQMADRLGLSDRQLRRRCLAVFGYGPRRLARILRMTRALDEARSGLPLAQVAAFCGYADQAYLCRELLALGGATPTSLLAELGGQRGEEIDRVSVGIMDDGVAHSPEGVPRR
jgi:AraC-like DNA-binding protein